MPSISITIPSVPVVQADTTWDDPIVITDPTPDAENNIVAPIGNRVNNGNVTEIFEIDVTNIANGTLEAVLIDNPVSGGVDSFGPSQLPATMEVPAGQSVGASLHFDYEPGDPGEPSVDVTADYTAAWQ